MHRELGMADDGVGEGAFANWRLCECRKEDTTELYFVGRDRWHHGVLLAGIGARRDVPVDHHRYCLVASHRVRDLPTRSEFGVH